MKRLSLSLAALFMLSLPSLALACGNANCPMGEDCPYENCANCPDCPMSETGKQGKKGKSRQSDFFNSADTNNDGMLSREEFQAAKQAGWHKRADCPLSRTK